MKLPRGTGILLVEALYHSGSILYIGSRFPSAVMFFIALPVHKVLESTSINTGSYNIVHFVLLIALFGDLNRAGLRHRLAGKGP